MVHSRTLSQQMTTLWFVCSLSTCFWNTSFQNTLQMNLMMSRVSTMRSLSRVSLRQPNRGRDNSQCNQRAAQHTRHTHTHTHTHIHMRIRTRIHIHTAATNAHCDRHTPASHPPIPPPPPARCDRAAKSYHTHTHTPAPSTSTTPSDYPCFAECAQIPPATHVDAEPTPHSSSHGKQWRCNASNPSQAPTVPSSACPHRSPWTLASCTSPPCWHASPHIASPVGTTPTRER
jgi:hypothetical protein